MQQRRPYPSAPTPPAPEPRHALPQHRASQSVHVSAGQRHERHVPLPRNERIHTTGHGTADSTRYASDGHGVAAASAGRVPYLQVSFSRSELFLLLLDMSQAVPQRLLIQGSAPHSRCHCRTARACSMRDPGMPLHRCIRRVRTKDSRGRVWHRTVPR